MTKKPIPMPTNPLDKSQKKLKQNAPQFHPMLSTSGGTAPFMPEVLLNTCPAPYGTGCRRSWAVRHKRPRPANPSDCIRACRRPVADRVPVGHTEWGSAVHKEK